MDEETGQTESRCSLLEAIHEKYDSPEPLQINILVPKGAPGKKESGLLVLPEHLSLNGHGVTHAGSPSDISALCGKICELDLTNNKLNNWAEVFIVLEQMPRLTFVNLSDNPLGGAVCGGLQHQQPFPRIQHLVLNKTAVPWESVWQLLDVFPNLTELHLSLNGYSSVEAPPGECTPYPSLSHLYLNTNPLQAWDTLLPLGQMFPALQHLVMVGNPHLTALPDDMTASITAFPRLHSLNLMDGGLATWPELHKLHQMPTLQDVRLAGMPLLQAYAREDARALMVAYLPGIARLNGSPVSAEERENAERAFIRRYMDAEEKPNRYMELEATYGRLDPLAEVDFSVKDSVSVTVHYEDQTKLYTFSLRATAADVRRTVAPWIGQTAAKLSLYHDEGGGEQPYGSTFMMYQERTLLRYRVQDGDKITVELTRGQLPKACKPWRPQALKH